jgi:hypothetical protein
MDITLLSTESKLAGLTLGLNEKPEPEPEPDEDDDQEQVNETNSTDTSSDTSSSTTNNSSSTTRSYVRRRNSTSSSTSNSNDEEKNGIEKKFITGASTIHITVNLTLTMKAGIVFLVAAIILSGLFVYKQTTTVGGKRKRKKYGRRSKAEILFDKVKRKLKAKLREIFKRVRIKLGELIAGEEFEKEDESDNKKHKNKKKY